MLYFFSGTDREKARALMQKEVLRVGKDATIVRITDAHTPADFSSALQGGGMFGGTHIVIFENILSHEEIAPMFLSSLASIAESKEHFFLFEEKPNVATRKQVEKYATTSERFDAPKSARDTQVFDLAYALERGDKKKLWVGYMREIAKGSAPEAVHGVLFWAAKSYALKSREGSDAQVRAKRLVARLAELPHEARRSGFDMEYALEAFVLSGA